MVLKENPTKTKEEFQCGLLGPVASTWTCGWRRSQYLQGTLLYLLLQSGPKFTLNTNQK